MKIFLIIILFSLSSIYGQDSLRNINPPIQEYPDTGYPALELTVGFGFLWLLQGNITYSPIRYLYIQPHGSLSILTSEYGITFGLQKRHEKDSLIRMGLGFSKGSTTHFTFTGGGEERRWNSYYFSMGVLMRKGKDFVYYPNINITDTGEEKILSLNFTIGKCTYR
jgi:hypothetical protein